MIYACPMWAKRIVIWGWILCVIPSMGWGACHRVQREHQTPSVEINLMSVVWSARPDVNLGQLAVIASDDLETVKRLTAFPVGIRAQQQLTEMDCETLETLLIQAGVIKRGQIRWTGSPHVTVHRWSNQIDGQLVASVALRALEDEFHRQAINARASIRTTPLDWSISTESLALTVRHIPEQLEASKNQVIWVDAFAAGQFVRRIPVGIHLEGDIRLILTTNSKNSPVMETARPHLPLKIAPPNMATMTTAHTRSNHIPASPQTFDSSQKSLTSDRSAVARGAVVKLLVQGGAVHIETKAESLQSGGIGDVIRIRPHKSGEVLLAKVIANGTVELVNVQ